MTKRAADPVGLKEILKSSIVAPRGVGAISTAMTSGPAARRFSRRGWILSPLILSPFLAPAILTLRPDLPTEAIPARETVECSSLGIGNSEPDAARAAKDWADAMERAMGAEGADSATPQVKRQLDIWLKTNCATPGQAES